jgi:hypothetical protein
MKYLDSDHAARLRTLLLHSSQEFSPAWIEAGRVVVPTREITDLSNDPNGARLLEAFRSAGYRELMCLTTDDLGTDEPEQAVTATLDEVDDWRWSLAPFDVVLTTTDLSIAALLSVDEFVLIAGDPNFVETAIGKPISAAKAEFRAYASSTANASRHLPALADRYQC